MKYFIIGNLNKEEFLSDGLGNSQTDGWFITKQVTRAKFFSVKTEASKLASAIKKNPKRYLDDYLEDPLKAQSFLKDVKALLVTFTVKEA